MKTRILFLPAAIQALALFACGRLPVAPAQAPGEAAIEALQSGPGAFDVIKMGRYAGRMGPVYFAHGLHAGLPGLDGKTIACSACHRETCGPQRRCGECHVPAERGTRPKIPTT